MLQSARCDRKVHLTQGSHIAAPQEICAMVWLWHVCEVPTGSELVCLSGQTGNDPCMVRKTRLSLNGPRALSSRCRNQDIRNSVLRLKIGRGMESRACVDAKKRARVI